MGVMLALWFLLIGLIFGAALADLLDDPAPGVPAPPVIPGVWLVDGSSWPSR